MLAGLLRLLLSGGVLVEHRAVCSLGICNLVHQPSALACLGERVHAASCVWLGRGPPVEVLRSAARSVQSRSRVFYPTGSRTGAF